MSFGFVIASTKSNIYLYLTRLAYLPFYLYKYTSNHQRDDTKKKLHEKSSLFSPAVCLCRNHSAYHLYHGAYMDAISWENEPALTPLIIRQKVDVIRKTQRAAMQTEKSDRLSLLQRASRTTHACSAGERAETEARTDDDAHNRYFCTARGSTARRAKTFFAYAMHALFFSPLCLSSTCPLRRFFSRACVRAQLRSGRCDCCYKVLVNLCYVMKA